jgi:large subunit ribosomal protein L21
MAHSFVSTACHGLFEKSEQSVPAQRVYHREARLLYAIFETGGKQFKVAEGTTLYVEKLDGAPGDSMSFDKVFLIEQDGQVKVGAPYVNGASVTASIVEHGRGKKIIVYKYKSKKNYRRKQGHRQPFTKLRVTSIQG